MDINHLVAFERIVREGSFSAAARLLDIQQSTISARIQLLEQEVGGPLFTRGGRKPTLTERGASFLPYARRILELHREGIEAAHLAQEGKSGRISIGTLPSVAEGFLCSTIVRFHALHPQVNLFVRLGENEHIVAMLYDGTVKVGLVTWPFLNTTLMPLMHFREPLALVVSAKHPLAEKRRVTQEDLQRMGKPFLFVNWGPSAQTLLSHLTALMGSTIEISFMILRYLLLGGMGTALLMRPLIAEDLAAGRLVELHVEDLPDGFRETALVQLAHERAPKAPLAEFIHILHQEAGELCISESRPRLTRK